MAHDEPRPKKVRNARNASKASFAAPMGGTEERVAATAQLGENIRQMMIAIRILDRVMRNIYIDNPGKIAAWISASHVERAPKRKAPTPTP